MSSTNDSTTTWVARGSAGTVGTIYRDEPGFRVRLVGDDTARGPFATLEVAKSALHAALGPGADRPEFSAH
jgi:hypothetical protein